MMTKEEEQELEEAVKEIDRQLFLVKYQVIAHISQRQKPELQFEQPPQWPISLAGLQQALNRLK